MEVIPPHQETDEMSGLIGIDLGTTNGVAAIADGPWPRVLDSREAHPQIRSVVGQRRKSKKGNHPQEILVGDAAYDNWDLAQKDTILSIKHRPRRSGRRSANDARPAAAIGPSQAQVMKVTRDVQMLRRSIQTSEVDA